MSQGKAWERPRASGKKPQETKTQETKTEEIQRDFHNPYNFVPTPSRKTKDKDLGDFEPVGHHQYLDSYWSGRITCKLKTFTPLLIPDAANLREAENDHKIYPVRMLDDKPYLAPTSVKGMLRSAYEAVTNSRFGIFEEHEEKLAYRMSATGIGVVPARVERQNGKLMFRLMRDPSSKRACIANLLCYSKSEEKKKYQNGAEPQHGDAVWVTLQPNSNGRGNQEVNKIEPRNLSDETEKTGWKKGWVCITEQNIEKKKYERVFLESGSEFLDIKSQVKEEWEKLIKNYQEIHKKDLEKRERDEIPPNKYLGNEPGKTAWSRHIYTDNADKLEEGTLCYLLLEGQKVKAALPVIISRRLYEENPLNLLHESLHPAVEMKDLSPSDRVFGWVNQRGTGAYRGQLRISNVVCQSNNSVLRFNDDGLALGILGEPKPEQVRFYLAKDKNGEPFDSNLKKGQGYQTGQHLRGRKVYPHHQNTNWNEPEKDSTKAPHKEYRRYGGTKDSQNRSVEGWINAGTTFEFTLNVVNLSPVELGALLWLLDLRKYHNDENNDKLYHRLGGGKPLGFGSVRVEITETDLRLGTDWRKFYRSLSPSNASQDKIGDCVEEFKKAAKEAYSNDFFEKIDFIAAFIQCAKGFDDKKPIHYPRRNAQVASENKNYEWFVENEKESRNVNGRKLPLSKLTGDDGLPYDPLVEITNNPPATNQKPKTITPPIKKNKQGRRN